jgi:hypothetical protein
MISAGGKRVWCGTGTARYRETTVLLLVGATDCSTTAHRLKTFRVICSQRVHSANAFRMDSSNLSLTTKPSACAYITLLAGIVC